MSWACDVPDELLCRPTGLVILSGLDTTYNAVHKAVWDSFCNNRRPDRVPLKFKDLEADHEYPKCRTKRTPYEWYIPKGVIKTQWMYKHLETIPAAVVIFFDLDWDELLWKEKQMECATRVEIVRNSLLGRNTRVAVVLIQKNAPLPPGEDVIAAERAASLCTACELSAKSLFVLPHTDHLLGYVIRLENAFYELAQSYYYTEAKRVKSHKEYLNKTTHQFLFVRHQFKIGFYNELKQDTHLALKHYKQAYGHTLDLRMHDTNLLEVKSVAGFLNYKICRLSFQHNVPLDAIAQFRKHIDFFKGRVGCPDLAFEHSSWTAKQFHIFADLFDEAIKLGLTAVQTQHPGFYYQQAANHAIARKQLCLELCHVIAAVPYPDPLENLNNLDYYGQRPWRQGHQSIEPPDGQRERDGIKALHQLELTVDHASLIIPLLSNAVAQFKKYKSPRMKRYLMVQMGEEYYHAQDYQKALTILSRVTWDYRWERWWPLLTSIQMTSLRCAYLTCSIQDYVIICMELLNKDIVTAQQEKVRVQNNLLRVIANQPPEPEPNCVAECTAHAQSLWLRATSADGDQDGVDMLFTVDMNTIPSFVECRAMFTADSFHADQKVELHIFLRASSPNDIKFSKLSVLLNNTVYNAYCTISCHGNQDGASEFLHLRPGKVNKYTFTFLPASKDVGKQINITSIALELGSELSRCAVLHWSNGVINSLTNQHRAHDMTYKDGDSFVWAKIPMIASTSIKQRGSLIDVTLTHNPPSLVNEFYKVDMTINNKELDTITNLSLSVGLADVTDSNLEQTTHVCVDNAEYDGKIVSRRLGLSLPDLLSQQSMSKTVYVKCLQTGVRPVLMKIQYDVVVCVDGENITCQCCQEEKIDLCTIIPFNVNIRLNSMKLEVIQCVHADVPFLLLSEIHTTSPWKLEFKTSDVKLSPYVKSSAEDEIKSFIEGLLLRKDERACECYCLQVAPSLQLHVPLGIYTVHWRRYAGTDCTTPFVSTTVTFPTPSIENIPLYIESDLPSHGSVRVRLPLRYTLYNRTAYVQDVDITMDGSENFMYSGYKQLHFQILPSSDYKLTFNLFPLLTGSVELPKLRVNVLRFPGVMTDMVQKMLPTHIFIKPCGKELQPTLV